jgi:hypothetical protein
MQEVVRSPRTPEEVRNKILELGRTLVFMNQKHQQKRATIREQVKILYWALGELDDKDLL